MRWIHGNGNAGSLFEHETYTPPIGIVYAYNRFGPLRAGAPGNNLKDRSAGLVVRNNWIGGGNRRLDLVDGEDSQVIVDDPSYRETFVYGNVLIEPDGAGHSQIIDLSHNWTKSGWVESHSGAAGVFDDGSGIESAAPGFADEGAQDYRPASTAEVAAQLRTVRARAARAKLSRAGPAWFAY